MVEQRQTSGKHDRGLDIGDDHHDEPMNRTLHFPAGVGAAPSGPGINNFGKGAGRPRSERRRLHHRQVSFSGTPTSSPSTPPSQLPRRARIERMKTQMHKRASFPNARLYTPRAYLPDDLFQD